MGKIKTLLKKILKRQSYLEILTENGFMHGENFNMYNSTIDMNFCHLISVGNNVTMSNCTILAHDATTKMYLGKTKIGKVTIGDNVFIGYNSIILFNVTIGNNVIIGAGSLVNKNIPDNSIVAGNPAVVIGQVDSYIEKHKRLLETSPVFSSGNEERDVNLKKEMILRLNNQIGYDD